MSYRTYINEEEWLGNNEGPRAILEELERQGCPFNDGCCTPIEGFEVKDLDALVKATEQAIIEMVKEKPAITNFNDDIQAAIEHGYLTDKALQLSQNAYIFWSAKLLNLIGKENYEFCYDVDVTTFKVTPIYRLKPGVKVIFKAY